MEEGQRRDLFQTIEFDEGVLILVVMEEGQRQIIYWIIMGFGTKSLNPCCNGRGSKTTGRHLCLPVATGLNPCCNGRGSKTNQLL